MNREDIFSNVYIIGNEEKSMKIERMTIDNICGIKHLDLTFNEGLNLICGENGVGKTTIVKAITHPFISNLDDLMSEYYGTERGIVNIWFYGSNNKLSYEISNQITTIQNTPILKREGDYILYFSSSRTLNFPKLYISNPLYSSETDHKADTSILLEQGIYCHAKSWFEKVSVGNLDCNNLSLCKQLFNLIDENLHVIQTNSGIVFKHKNNKVTFDMLSDGFKSCISVLLCIVMELERRYLSTVVANFNGIVIIDEIDLHLHPQWQSKLVKVLQSIIPSAQIIITTHSPSVLQNANAGELIPLYEDTDGDIHVKELHLGEYGLQGWTLEEIMKDVMGMQSTTSDLYAQTIKEFDEAMYEENIPLIKEKYETLCKMLHPKSTLRQLLKIQMTGMEE